MNRHYDLVDLRVLIAVAAEGNLSRGALRCHLAPSSVSLRIKELEESMGTRLLVREARGVSLTPAGRIFVEHAKLCFAQLDQLHVDLMPYAKGIAGHVTLFANNNAMSFLPNDLAIFFAKHPSVRVTLEERMSHDIVNAVVTGRAAIGIVALDTQHPELQYLPYRRDELVLLAPRHHPISRRKSILFAECLSEPFICLAQGSALHAFLLNQAASLGTVLDVRVQLSGYRAIAQLVAAGAGLGIIPKSAVQPGDIESIAVVKLSDSWSYRDLHICFNPKQPSSAFCNDLVDILCNSLTAHTV